VVEAAVAEVTVALVKVVEEAATTLVKVVEEADPLSGTRRHSA
jgi:hypothetical protein